MKKKPEVNFIEGLTSLPIPTMLAVVNTMLQNLSLREIAEACFEHDVDPGFGVDERQGSDE